MNPLDALLGRSVREYEPVRAPELPAGLSRCRVHEVAWHGPKRCWCCEAGLPEVSRG